MKVVAFTQGKKAPASRFRVRQLVPELARHDIAVADYCPFVHQHVRLPGVLNRIRRRYLLPVALTQYALNVVARSPGSIASWSSDVTWISRGFLPGLQSLVVSTKAPRVLDVDDAVWITEPGGASAASKLAARMDKIVVGNSYLADWYSSYCNDIVIVPTSIDLSRYRLKADVGASETDSSAHFVIGWTGTSGNFPELYAIEHVLATFLKDFPRSKLLVVADRAPCFRHVPEGSVQFERWTPETEVSALHKMHVGIMPLTDSPWTRGKCSFKMLQYMSVGLPYVVSPVGMNIEVHNMVGVGRVAGCSRHWYEALADYYSSAQLRKDVGATGRAVVVREFSVESAASKMADVFRSLL